MILQKNVDYLHTVVFFQKFSQPLPGYKEKNTKAPSSVSNKLYNNVSISFFRAMEVLDLLLTFQFNSRLEVKTSLGFVSGIEESIK